MLQGYDRMVMLALTLVLTASLWSAETIAVDPERCVILLHCPYEAPNKLGGRDRIHWQWMQEAAAELQTHLAKITSVEIPVESRAAQKASTEDSRFPFYVDFRHPDDRDELVIGEMRWRVTEQGAWLYGRDGGGERTTMFAVCDFLERQFGVRWLAPGEKGVYVNRQNPLKLTLGGQSWTPSLVSRRIRRGVLPIKVPEADVSAAQLARIDAQNRLVDETNKWSLRMRMGGQNPAASHSFTDWWERFGETHPDYFAKDRNGKVKPPAGKHGAKICPSNPAVARQLVEDWLPHKDRQQVLRCGVNDGQGGFCECEDCLALDVPREGEAWNDHLTDRYAVLANRVARLAREHRPDAQVAMYAYMTTLYAPRREQLEPTIIVTLVPYVDPLDPAVVRAHVDGWREAGAQAFVFRPNYPFKYLKGVIPTGIDEHYFKVFQAAYRAGMISANYDMLRHNWPVTGMTEYILAKAMSEPDQPFEHWEAHYCAGYGPAAEQVAAYFRYWREEVWEKRLHPDMYEILGRAPGGDFDWGLMTRLDPYYQIADLDQTDSLLKQALDAAISEADQEKIRQLVLANRHARLLFQALTVRGTEMREAAQALGDFRNTHAAELRLQWGNIGWFERERLKNAPGIVVRYEDENGERLRVPAWDLVDEEALAERAATWQGGEHDWQSDNWRLPGGGYPGDAGHVGKRADLMFGGRIHIGAGDSIRPGLLYFHDGAPAIVQSGGQLVPSHMYYLSSRYELQDGWLLPNVLRLGGGVLLMTGGQLGNSFIGGYPGAETDLNTVLQLRAGTVDIHGGVVDLHSVNVPAQLQVGGESVIRITGTKATVSALYADFSAIPGATSRLEYVFSEDGVASWGRGRDGLMRTALGTGEAAADLRVDVSACRRAGGEAFTLLRYASLAGAFGTVTVTDEALGMLTPAETRKLAPGEYRLNYHGNNGTELHLIYHNTP